MCFLPTAKASFRQPRRVRVPRSSTNTPGPGACSSVSSVDRIQSRCERPVFQTNDHTGTTRELRLFARRWLRYIFDRQVGKNTRHICNYIFISSSCLLNTIVVERDVRRLAAGNRPNRAKNRLTVTSICVTILSLSLSRGSVSPSTERTSTAKHYIPSSYSFKTVHKCITFERRGGWGAFIQSNLSHHPIPISV